MAIQWTHLWQALNNRQQHFLRTLYRAEADRAAYYNSQRAMFDPLKKGAQWRWLVHNPVGGGGLQRELKDEPDPKLRNNQGSGSTYKVLEEAGYLDRRWEIKELYSLAYGKRSVSVLSVRLTPRGRKLAKMFLQDETTLQDETVPLENSSKAPMPVNTAEVNDVAAAGSSRQAERRQAPKQEESILREEPVEKEDELTKEDELMRTACNPDGFVDVALRAGGYARVSPDAPPELLEALNAVAEIAHQEVKSHPAPKAA